MFRLIRVRLALSYAGIALLVSLSLGAVLLVRLNAYYSGMELDYQINNAKSISDLAAPMLIQKYPKEVQDAQVSNLAFLSQARVRILDLQKNVLADSGPWQSTKIGLGVMKATKVRFPLGGQPDAPPTSIIVVESRSPDGASSTMQFQNELPSGVTVAGGGPQRDMLFLSSSVPVTNGVYGMYLNPSPGETEARSAEIMLQPIIDSNGAMLGYVELSESPAYGREILNSVASGLAVAGGLAILLAIGAGWLTSYRLTAPLSNLTQATQQMSSGDLAVRVVEAGRTDEFGTLGKSFNQMAGRIEETVQTLRRFLSDAAHELQTPLTALRTNLELARSEANSPETDRYLNLALGQIERLQRLIKDLLSLSRLESANGQEVFQPVELNQVIRQVSEPFAARAEQAGQAFALDLPSGPAFVTGNSEKLSSALVNLIDNAIKFTPAGGRVTIHLEEAPGCFCLTISDTGIGIPPEEIEMLFNRFHRARNALTYPGSGLGLAIVKIIAQAHGGHVQVINNPQGGASFILCLPCANAASSVPPTDERWE